MRSYRLPESTPDNPRRVGRLIRYPRRNDGHRTGDRLADHIRAASIREVNTSARHRANRRSAFQRGISPTQ